MRLSQKKNCNGCKGGWHNLAPFNQVCELGFKVKSEGYTGIPQEPCYKPLTNDGYMIARDLRRGMMSEAKSDESELNCLVICAICGKALTDTNRARKENGEFRDDAFGRPWCIPCTETHDSIDWDKVYHR